MLLRRHRLWGTLTVPAALIVLAGCGDTTTASGAASPAAASHAADAAVNSSSQAISALHPPTAFTTKGGFALASLHPWIPDGADADVRAHAREQQTWVLTDDGIASLGAARDSDGLQIVYSDLSGHQVWSESVPAVTPDPSPAGGHEQPSVRLLEEDGQQWIAVLQPGLSDPDSTAAAAPKKIFRVDTYAVTGGKHGAHVDVLDAGYADSPITTVAGSRTLLVADDKTPGGGAALLSPSTGKITYLPGQQNDASGHPMSSPIDQVNGTALYTNQCGEGFGASNDFSVDCYHLGGVSVPPSDGWVWDGRYGVADNDERDAFGTTGPSDTKNSPFQIVDGPHQTMVTVPWSCGSNTGAETLSSNNGNAALVTSPTGRFLMVGDIGINVAAKQMVCDDNDAVEDFTAVSDTGTAYASLNGVQSTDPHGVAQLDLTDPSAVLKRLPGVDALPLAVSADGHGVFAVGSGMSGQIVVLPPAK